jgi:predicted Zn-dependent protease with MMP-like domain
MNDRDLAIIESIYDALDEGRPEQALALARDMLRQSPDDDPVLRFLAGRALMELERLDEAERELQLAVALDADDPEFRTDLAECLYLSCRFDDALEHARRAVVLDDAFADAHYLLALLLEREGEDTAADRHFARADRLDSDRFPAPLRVDGDEFERQLDRARAMLPDAFREHLERVGLFVEELPSVALLFEETPPLSPELLGLFAGVTIDGQSYLSAGGELPPRIYLFKRNLERSVQRAEELADQIRVTLYHELGHYLGMEEEDLEESGYA